MTSPARDPDLRDDIEHVLRTNIGDEDGESLPDDWYHRVTGEILGRIAASPTLGSNPQGAVDPAEMPIGERQAVLDCINIYGDETLHGALDSIGWPQNWKGGKAEPPPHPGSHMTDPARMDLPERKQTITEYECPVCGFWKNNVANVGGPCRRIGCDGIVEAVTFVRQPRAGAVDPERVLDRLRRLRGFYADNNWPDSIHKQEEMRHLILEALWALDADRKPA